MTDDVLKQASEGLVLMQKYSDVVIEYALKYTVQVILAIFILLIGYWIANKVTDVVLKAFNAKRMDVTLAKFFAGALKITIMAFVFLMAMDKLGITISPLIAAVSAMVFGTSFALQAPLSNFAAGLVVILTRPFVIGNTITVNGVSGVVEEVKLPSTVLVNADGEKITIPNKHIVGEVLYNSDQNKVVERSIGISYGDDPRKAIAVIQQVLDGFAQIAKTPAYQVGIDQFGDSSVNIGMRYWVPTRQYYKTLYDVNLAVYEAIGKAGITIPFPQRDIHIKSKE